jgi:hypothetical protein
MDTCSLAVFEDYRIFVERSLAFPSDMESYADGSVRFW